MNEEEAEHLLWRGDLQSFHLPPQSGAVHTQCFSCLLYLAVVFAEGLKNQFVFEFIHGSRSLYVRLHGGFFSQIRGEILGTDVAGLAENKCVLNDILKFTNIPRVVVVQQNLQGRVSKPGDMFALYPVKVLDKVVDEKGYVLPSLPEGRDIDGDHIEPIVEVFPKFTRLDT